MSLSTVAVPAYLLPQAGAANAEQAASIARVAQKVRDIKASRPTTKLMDASELPAKEREARCAWLAPNV